MVMGLEIEVRLMTQPNASNIQADENHNGVHEGEWCEHEVE